MRKCNKNVSLTDSPSQENGIPVPKSTEEPRPRLPAGPYDAQCIEAKLYWDNGFRRWVAMLAFELIPARTLVNLYLNLGGAAKPHAGMRSLYRRAWITAAGRQPHRGEELNLDVFINSFFEIDVQDVTQTWDQQAHPPAEIYSRVARIVRRLIEKSFL